MLDENASFMTLKQTERHVAALNRADPKSLDTEWEVVVLNAFSRIGKVRHEVDFGGPTRADLHFRSAADPAAEFVADVATVTDAGYEDDNPLRAFGEELVRVIRKARLEPNRFSYEVLGRHEGEYRDSKVKLALPGRAELATVLRGLDGFFDAIRASPESRASHVLQPEKLGISVTYDPRQPYMGGSYPSYTVVYSLTRNPVYNTLKRKADQLKKTGFAGCKGIILCDGGCDLLREKYRGSTSFLLPDVVNEFLRQQTSIAFVLVVTFAESQPMRSRRRDVRLWVRPFCRQSFVTDNAVLAAALGDAAMRLPQPVENAINAFHLLQSKERKMGRREGSLTLTGDSIEISARSLLEMLAGQITPDQFFAGFSSNRNEFSEMLRKGRLIDAITIREGSPDLDDDLVTLHFSPPDPAVTKFRARAPAGGDRGPERENGT